MTRIVYVVSGEGKQRRFLFTAVMRLHKIMYLKHIIVLKIVNAINLLNAIFFYPAFLLDPYILSGGAYIFPLLWVKTVLKFDIIIRT